MSLDIHAKVSADATALETVLHKVREEVGNVQKELVSGAVGAFAGMFGFETIKEVFKETIEYGEKIKNLGLRTGIGLEDLQKLDYAARLTNTSLDALVKGVEKFGI